MTVSKNSGSPEPEYLDFLHGRGVVSFSPTKDGFLRIQLCARDETILETFEGSGDRWVEIDLNGRSRACSGRIVHELNAIASHYAARLLRQGVVARAA